MIENLVQQQAEWDFWDEAGTTCVGYSSEIDQDLVRVFDQIRMTLGCSTIAKNLGLPEAYVELLQSILSSADFTEYGTSPRSCYPNPERNAEGDMNKLLEWYQNKWGAEDARALRSQLQFRGKPVDSSKS